MMVQWPMVFDLLVSGSTGRPLNSPSSNLEATEATLLILQSVLPAILAAVLLLKYLFEGLSRVGDFIFGWSSLDEDEDDDLALLSLRARRARRRRKEKLETTVQTRPRKLCLLIPLMALTLAFAIDGIVQLIRMLVSGRDILTPTESWPTLASLVCYAMCMIFTLVSSTKATTASISMQFIASSSMVLNTAILIALSVLFHLTFLGTCVLKFVAASFLLAAYHPRMRELVPPENSDLEGTETPSNIIDDVSGDPEEPEKPVRQYNFLTLLRRVRKFLPYVLPFRSRAAIFLTVICIILQLVSTVTAIILPQQWGSIVKDLTEGRPPWRNIAIWALMQALISSNGVLGVLQNVLWEPVQEKASTMLSIMCYSHILQLGMHFHGNKNTGEVLQVLNRSGTLQSGLTFLLFRVGPLIIQLIGSLGYVISHFGWPLLCIVLASSACHFIVNQATRTKLRALRTARNDRMDHLNGLKVESLGNVELLKYFGMETYETKRYTTAILKSVKADWRTTIFRSTMNLSLDLVELSSTVAGALYMASIILKERKDLSLFVTFLAYTSSISGAIDSLQFLFKISDNYLIDTDKLMDLLEQQNEIIDAPDAEELLECQGRIDFENVTLVYEKDDKDTPAPGAATQAPRKALDNVSFTALPGQHVALVGESGAGKSSIFKMLYRFYDPTSGCVKVDGKDIRKYTQHSLRQALGVVQQEGLVFNDTIFGNIKYGCHTASDGKVVEAAKAAQIHDKIKEWPKGYYTPVGERGVKLSGGEKQRVNIARTILKDAKVLLLDEATSALDSNTERAIQEQIKKLTQGKTTIAIAHRLSTIAHADLIIVLDKGRVVESGKHHELLQIEGGFYQKLWSAQTSSGTAPEDEAKATIEQAP